MALIKCSECGKEISDKANACPNCGCPVVQQNVNKEVRIGQTVKARKKLIIISISVVVIILVCIGIFKTKNKNPFTQYLEYMGKSYMEIPEDYEILSMLDTWKVAQAETEDVFGLPGEISLTYLYDEEIEDFGNIDIISWNSRTEDDLTDSQVETFLSEMKKIYGDWEKIIPSDQSKNKYCDYMVYAWKTKKEYDVRVEVEDDMSALSVVWHNAETEHVE